MIHHGSRWVLLLAAWVACASPGSIPVVRSEYMGDEDFGAYHRYAWLPRSDEDSRRTQPEEHRLHDRIREAIDRVLTSKGFVRGGREDADFLVTYHCKVSEELSAEVMDRVIPDPGGNWEQRVTPQVKLTRFEQGSIVIDFVNAQTDRRTWRGVARGRLAPDALPDELDRIVDRSVREILDEFPPS